MEKAKQKSREALVASKNDIVAVDGDIFTCVSGPLLRMACPSSLKTGGVQSRQDCLEPGPWFTSGLVVLSEQLSRA